MATTALMLMTLLTHNNNTNNNIMKNMYDIKYLRALEKNKLKQHYESMRYKKPINPRNYKHVRYTNYNYNNNK